MASERASIFCIKCGREIKEPGRYCPYCAAELPGQEEEGEERKEQDPNIGYWNFYGAIPDDENLTAGPMGARGWLRFIAVALFVLSAVAALGFNGWSWTFRWGRAGLILGIGLGVAVVLFALSFAFKKQD